MGGRDAEDYRGARLVPRPAGKAPPPDWLDLVRIDFPEAAGLHGKEFQRGAAKRLVDWWRDTGGDPAKLPPPYKRMERPGA